MSDLLTFSPPHCLNSALYRLFPKLRPFSGWCASLLLFRNSFCRMGWTQSFLDARTIWLICSFFRAIKVNPLISAEGGTLILVRDFFVKVRQDFKVSPSPEQGREAQSCSGRCDTGTLTQADGLRTRSSFLNTSLCWQLLVAYEVLFLVLGAYWFFSGDIFIVIIL